MKFLKYFLLLILMVAPSMAGALSRSKPTPDQQEAIQARRKAIQDARKERDRAKVRLEDAQEEVKDAEEEVKDAEEDFSDEQKDLQRAEEDYEEETRDLDEVLSESGVDTKRLNDLRNRLDALVGQVDAVSNKQREMLDDMPGDSYDEAYSEIERRDNVYFEKARELEITNLLPGHWFEDKEEYDYESDLEEEGEEVGEE